MYTWITWERQRRSIELAKKLKCKLYLFEYTGLKGYFLSIIKTSYVLFKDRPEVLFVQDPSRVLALLACLYGILTNTYIVVDRHSTFRLKKPHSGSLKIWLIMRMHYFTLKHANLTIVTNEYLANLVREAGGRSFVLPDMLPDIKCNATKKIEGRINLLMISSFGLDEPICEVIDAMRLLLDEDIYLYITGNYKKCSSNLHDSSPENVHFTGFIPDDEFISLLFSVDIVLVFTTSDYCMLCGCYEAISAEKPLITSNKSVLRDYFKDAVFVENTSDDIMNGIKTVSNNIKLYSENTKKMKGYLSSSWEILFNKLLETINHRKAEGQY